MKNRQRKYIDRIGVYEFGRFATVFSLLGMVTSIMQAVVFLLYILWSIFAPDMWHSTVVGLILSVFATLSAIAATEYGNKAKKQNKNNNNYNNNNLSLVSTVLSVVAATLSFCCINHPYARAHLGYVVPILLSGIFNLIAVALYANFWTKFPKTDEEMHAFNTMPLDERYARDCKDKKKFAITILVSFLSFSVTVSAVIPTEYYKNCDIIYDLMINEMGRSGTQLFGSEHTVNLDRYLDELPDGYRDTDSIKEQNKIFKKLDAELKDSHTEVEFRNALSKMYGLKKIDDRWDFSAHNRKELLYCDATWKLDDYYLTIGQITESEYSQQFSSNLPYKLPDYVDKEVGEITLSGTRRRHDGSGFFRYDWILVYDLRYECDGEVKEFSIDVCRVNSVSYSLEEEQFILDVYCYETRKYYDMKLS